MEGLRLKNIFVGGEIVFWLKSCLRCHGDLSGTTDNYGSFIYCLQCGHYLTEAEEATLKSEANPKRQSLQEAASTFPVGTHIKLPPISLA